MIEDGGVRWAFLIGATLVLSLLIVLRPDSSTASAFGLVAGLCVAAFALLSLIGPSSVWTRVDRPPEVATIVTLRQSFRDGRIGQQRIVEALTSLERNARKGAVRPKPGPAEILPEERTPEAFRRWVVERMDELERAT